MRIGINLFDLVPGQGRGGGGETYLTRLVHSLAKIDHENEYVLFVNRDNQAKFSVGNRNFRQFVAPLDSKKKWTRAVWEQMLLPFHAWRLGLDVLHAPFNTAPIFCPVRTVATIHDMNQFYYRDQFPGADTFKMKFQRFVLRRGTRHCDRIIAVSRFSQQEAERCLGIESGRITVVHEAHTSVPAMHVPRAPSRLLLAVASDGLHKNLPRLIRSLALVKQRLGPNFRLIVAGTLREHSTNQSTGRHDLLRIAQEAGVSDVLELRGFVSDGQLEQLYHQAACLVFPTLYEGFGLPVLEAMAHGLPVLCSNIGPLAEIGGDNALYFDPQSEADMAETICHALTNPQRLADLSGKGLDRVKSFSWEEAARATLAVYKLAGHA